MAHPLSPYSRRAGPPRRRGRGAGNSGTASSSRGREDSRLAQWRLGGFSMISRRRGPGAARAAPRRLMGPSSPTYRGYGWIGFRLSPARQRRPHGFAAMAQCPDGSPSAIRARRDGCIARLRFAMIPPRCPSSIGSRSPVGISVGGPANSGAVDEGIRATPTDFAPPPRSPHRQMSIYSGHSRGYGLTV